MAWRSKRQPDLALAGVASSGWPAGSAGGGGVASRGANGVQPASSATRSADHGPPQPVMRQGTVTKRKRCVL